LKYFPMILKHLRHNWVRSSSTVLALSICIFLFCTLQTFVKAVNWNLQSANASRLITRHRVSLAFNLPVSYKQRIATIPGVRSVVATNWFGGAIPGRPFKDFFQNMAVEPEPYLAMYPEYILPDDQKRAFVQDLRGCIIGRKTAEKFGWKIGDSFQLESFIPPYRIGKPFEFVVRGIIDADEKRYPGTNLDGMFFQWKYLYEATGQRANVGTYVVEIGDPSQAGAVSKTIDSLFENSDVQTRTETESAFRAGFIAMAGNLALLLNVIGLAVTFTILLVTANTMSMAVRERRTEIAVLKTLGFPNSLILTLILSESLVIGALGGVIGILIGRTLIHALPSMPFIGDAVRGFPNLGLSPAVGTAGMGMALFIGLAAGIVPAFLASRTRISEMLRPV
jgi:putative ABC transport system permease protein